MPECRAALLVQLSPEAWPLRHAQAAVADGEVRLADEALQVMLAEELERHFGRC